MLRIFKETGPGVILLIIVLLTASWISAFIDPQIQMSQVYEENPMPLYKLLKILTGSTPFTGLILSIALESVMVILLIYFNTKVFFINERTFLPGVVYILLCSIFPANQVLNPVLPASIFLMTAIMRIMDSYRKPGIAYNFFDAALLISTGSLFYANLIWFGMLAFTGIALLRSVSIREIGLSLLGLVTPYVVLAGIYYVFDKDAVSLFSLVTQNLFYETESYRFTRITDIILIFTSISLILSISFLLGRLNTKKIQARKTFSLLLWGFFISLTLYFILKSVSVEMIWLTACPAAYFLTHYFIFARKKIFPEIIFSGLFLLIVVVQVIDIFRGSSFYH